MRRSILAMVALVLVLGCSQRGMSSRLQVDSKVAENATMSTYKTWNFARPENTLTGISLLDDSMFRAKAVSQIDKDMAARGLVRVFDDTADLKMMMHVLSEQKIDEVATANPEFNFASLPEGSEWEVGSLTMFLFDAKTSQMVWEGNAQAELDELASDKKRQERFVQVVSSLIATIPMGGSPSTP